MRYALFWNFAQRRIVVPYRRFCTTSRSHEAVGEEIMRVLTWFVFLRVSVIFLLQFTLYSAVLPSDCISVELKPLSVKSGPIYSP
jgi:hypothetical protein